MKDAQSKPFIENHARMIDKQYWNFRAKDYNISSLKTDEISLIEYFLEIGIINENSVILDVGCGPGVFSKTFAKYVKKVVALDISEEMLSCAKENNKENKNVEFIDADWATADLSKYEKSFDLVFAHMAPAIYDGNTLDRMMYVCRGYCYYAHFARRSSNVENGLNEVLNIGHTEPGHIRGMFLNLWDRGKFPQVSYEDRSSRKVMTTQEAIHYYKMQYMYPDSSDEIAKKYFEKISEDGKIEVLVNYKKGCLLWSV